MTIAERSSLVRRIGITLFTIVTGLTGLSLAAGGGYLLSLGGTAYYLVAGLMLLATAALYALRRPSGAFVYLVLYVGTWIWALAEVGFDFWGLLPRIVAPTILGFFAALLAPAVAAKGSIIYHRTCYGIAGATAVVFLVFVALMFRPHGVVSATAELAANTQATSAAQMTTAANSKAPSQWRFYGRDRAGTRFAPYDQITKDNIKDLEVAWTFHTGDPATEGADAEDTPIEIGDTLYTCSPRNKIFAIDADTGAEKWHFDPQTKAKRFIRCRGVGYYEDASAPADAPCSIRIVFTTNDARLMEVDAQNGQLCEGFANSGTIDLLDRVGNTGDNWYHPTSTPTIVDDHVIVGSYISDNWTNSAPPGVLRAFDVRSGRLEWVWNAGQLVTGEAVQTAEFRRGTPNVWSTPSVDTELGLIYVPTGNASPDHWGGQRTKEDDMYSSSVVALDYNTGQERWRFQTTHHDLWDYDVPSQPTLFDMPDGQGATVPAVFIPTKRGQIFVLDRRTGEPITEVTELPVPQGAAEGDYVSPTQPFSTGFPSIGDRDLTEASMWGVTPFDQLYCRIRFRQARYDGKLTPPGVGRHSLMYPGFYGGLNWGGVTIDARHGKLIANDIRIAKMVRLFPRPEVDQVIANNPASESGFFPMDGTPFRASIYDFMSPLNVPCQSPPWGTMTAIDLASRTIAWQVPLGTVEDAGPLNIPTHLPIPFGMPSVGGSVATASGLVLRRNA
ncbi:membrane-bound PQQ-dependent dehydrogenase, glucose/quinate/shikimate family [Agrobacterium pusense]|uniref:membrane-bound PQQ-dependent dehydrogenase, glucose/quinate/shikimate family n=1 Tax=Agrobacterium pusense TaxID=648995 RepID=UPI001CB79AB4|nr:membrane-bound PQQ-dependent dehydrogenase, glucose/quinate/shikimate family [Agrobacterium pusense]